MVTVEQLVSDVELLLNQGSISDDSELEKEQIKFWLTYELNELVATEINSKIQRGEMVPPLYVKRTAIEIPENEANDDVEAEDERAFISLGVTILDLNKDAGCVQVLTDEFDELKKTDIATIQQFKKLRFSKPTIENPVYYRVKDKIFVEGFKASELPFSKLFVDYVPKQDLSSLEDDDEVLVSALVLPELINRCVQRGKLMLYGTQPDRSNDGDDTKQTAYHTSIQRPE